MKYLFLGYGNIDRQDDGVAWHLLCEMMHRLGAPVPAQPEDEMPVQYGDFAFDFHLQLTPELADDMRVDDSVYRIVAGQPYPIRRSRGYAPQSIALPQELPQTLAVGAELKNTFCVTRENYAFLSHHIGDLENYETLLSFEQGIEHFTRLFRIQPEVVVADLHPDYLSTRYAQNYAVEKGLPLIQVQHHHDRRIDSRGFRPLF